MLYHHSGMPVLDRQVHSVKRHFSCGPTVTQLAGSAVVPFSDQKGLPAENWGVDLVQRREPRTESLSSEKVRKRSIMASDVSR